MILVLAEVERNIKNVVENNLKIKNGREEIENVDKFFRRFLSI